MNAKLGDERQHRALKNLFESLNRASFCEAPSIFLLDFRTTKPLMNSPATQRAEQLPERGGTCLGAREADAPEIPAPQSAA